MEYLRPLSTPTFLNEGPKEGQASFSLDRQKEGLDWCLEQGKDMTRPHQPFTFKSGGFVPETPFLLPVPYPSFESQNIRIEEVKPARIVLTLLSRIVQQVQARFGYRESLSPTSPY